MKCAMKHDKLIVSMGSFPGIRWMVLFVCVLFVADAIPSLTRESLEIMLGLPNSYKCRSLPS